MPRKVNYGADADDNDGYDDYDEYEEYDYDYDYEVEETAPQDKQEIAEPDVWRCAICTYDNDQMLSACEICGVLRGPLLRDKTTCQKRAVYTVSKGSGVSIMGKSLFAPLPRQASRAAVESQQQYDGSLMKGGTSFHLIENIQGQFHELLKAFNSCNHSHIDVEPFKFNVPSPDDVVTNGLHSSKMCSKANLSNSKASKVSSTRYDGNEQSSMKASDRSSRSRVSDMLDSVGDSGLNRDGVADTSSDSKGSNKSSGLKLKGKLNDFHESSLAIDQELSSKVSSSVSLKRHDDSAGSAIKKSKGHGLGSSNGVPLNVNSFDVGGRKVSSHTTYENQKWMLPDKSEDTQMQLSLAIVGHVDSGKSTLSGRLLHLLGRISLKEMHKYEKEAKLQGKGSFAYAWALDESLEERERGVTMTVAVADFESKKYHVVVLDSPGHRDFVPNMISGAAQADAAILVIDASLGSFEAGMDRGKGQTKEHAQLIRSFGVDQIIVAINKMDAVGYSKDRFEMIKSQLGTFLRSCGFKDSSISWIPLSAMENQNLVVSPSDIRLSSWYRGQHLLDAVDSLQPPNRDFTKPLLMPICDIVTTTSLTQVSACGKLETGAMRSGSKVLVMPSASIATVRSLERDSQTCSIARAGDNVAVSLQGVDTSQVVAGGVLCHPDFPVAVANHLELKVLVLDGTTPILVGSQLEFHVHHAKEAARVVKILFLLDPKTGKVSKKSPRCLVAKQTAVIEVILLGPVCVDEFSKCKALGRVYLRALGRTVAAGIVTRVIEER